MRLDASSGQEDLKALLEENLKLNKQILANTEKTRRYIFMMNILGWLKTLVFVVPIILGIIFLPPLIRQSMQYIQEIQKNIPGAAGLHAGGLDILKQYESLLKNR